MKTIPAQLRQKGGDTVAVEIPTDDEIQQIAERMHGGLTATLEEHGGWKVLYLPRGQRRFSKTEVDPFTLKRGKTAEDVAISPAEFTFGYGSDWRIILTWSNGDEALPVWHRYEDNLIRAPKHVTASLFA